MGILASILIAVLPTIGESQGRGAAKSGLDLGGLACLWEPDEDNDAIGYGGYLTLSGALHPSLDMRLSATFFREFGKEVPGIEVDLEMREISLSLLWKFEGVMAATSYPYLGIGTGMYSPDVELTTDPSLPAAEGDLESGWGYTAISGLSFGLFRGFRGFFEIQYRYVELETSGTFFGSDRHSFSGSAWVVGVGFSF